MREQIDAPPPGLRRDVAWARIKGHIEPRFADLELSVEACGISARTIHRPFRTDPARSVWFGGAALRRQACGIMAKPIGSITEICFSCGFDNSSHFSGSRRASIGTHRLAAKTSRSSVGHVRVGRIPVSLLSGPYEAKRRWHKQTKVVAHGHATGREEF
jgi:AraC-like DNA-binding protein